MTSQHESETGSATGAANGSGSETGHEADTAAEPESAGSDGPGTPTLERWRPETLGVGVVALVVGLVAGLVGRYTLFLLWDSWLWVPLVFVPVAVGLGRSASVLQVLGRGLYAVAGLLLALPATMLGYLVVGIGMGRGDAMTAVGGFLAIAGVGLVTLLAALVLAAIGYVLDRKGTANGSAE